MMKNGVRRHALVNATISSVGTVMLVACCSLGEPISSSDFNTKVV